MASYFFIKIYTNQILLIHMHDYINERKNNSMFIGGVTEFDVTKVVKNLKKKMSTVTISIGQLLKQ